MECPICYICIDNDNHASFYKSGCITNCNHHFHLTCLYKWTFIENQNNCPYCRTKLNEDLLDYQYTLRRILRMKQRQPKNTNIDFLLSKLMDDRINMLNLFCSKNYYLLHTIKTSRETSRMPKHVKHQNVKKIKYQNVKKMKYQNVKKIKYQNVKK